MSRAVRSAVGSAVVGPTCAPRRAGSGGGGGPVLTEHVVNPGITGDGAPWDNAGNAILVGNGAMKYFEDGFCNGVLDPAIPVNHLMELTLIYNQNPLGALFTVTLVDSNSESPISQIIYNDVPPAGGGSINLNALVATNNRDIIRVQVNAGGSNPQVSIQYVGLTTDGSVQEI